MINPLDSLDGNELNLILLQVMASVVLLALILFLSNKIQLNIGKQMITAGIRGLIQLILLSLILSYIFSARSILLQLLILGFMISFGAKTASDRMDRIPGVFRLELISLSIAVYTTMGLVSLIGAIPIDDPKIWIPIGGMATGNAMNISYLTINRIHNDLINRKDQIEASLSLGLTPAASLSRLQISSGAMVMAVTPNMNNLRTLGLVFIPGLMTGLLIGGIDPLVAAVYQVMIFFVIIGGGLLAAFISSRLIVYQLFDPKTHSINKSTLKL